MWHFLLFVFLGMVVGGYGTLIGVGGGFILVPVLLFLHPEKTPEYITSISLAVVSCNALMGSLAYARQGRIDYKSGLLFAVATIPGAILGAYSTAYVPRRIFDAIFGLIMIVVALFLLVRPEKIRKPTEGAVPFGVTRNIVGADGVVHSFRYNRATGVGLSLCIGYFSSLLGVGGGIIHVPALIHILNFPVHIATATSMLILAVTACTGVVVHAALGAFRQDMGIAIPLAVGVIFGAPLGAGISSRIQGAWVMRGFAVALVLVGLRTIMAAL
ncbi:MAG: sulfite exporter TauE/SafE family protein [Deltaproteobacteria bacterium]|nr:sulfite exporter TauE/SafE family protein [Deltaproteobacteria bacterium]